MLNIIVCLSPCFDQLLIAQNFVHQLITHFLYTAFYNKRSLQDDLQVLAKAQRSGTISKLIFFTIGDVSIQFIIVSLKLSSSMLFIILNLYKQPQLQPLVVMSHYNFKFLPVFFFSILRCVKLWKIFYTTFLYTLPNTVK